MNDPPFLHVPLIWPATFGSERGRASEGMIVELGQRYAPKKIPLLRALLGAWVCRGPFTIMNLFVVIDA